MTESIAMRSSPRTRDYATRCLQDLALRLERLALLADARVVGADVEAELAGNRAARERQLATFPGEREAPGFALARRFGLSAFELDVLDLAVGCALDPGFLAKMREGRSRRAPRIADALLLLASSCEVRLDLTDALATSRLWEAGLLRRREADGLDADLVPTRRTIAAMLGRGPLDRLPSWARWGGPAPTGWRFEVDPRRAAITLSGSDGGFLFVTGDPGSGKSSLARAIATAGAPRYLGVDVGACARAVGDDEVAIELAELVEDTALLGVPVVLDDLDPRLVGVLDHRLAEAFVRTGARAIVCVEPGGELDPRFVDRARLRIRLIGVSGHLASEMWSSMAGAEPSSWVGEEVVLEPRQIENAVSLARSLGIDPPAAIQASQRDAADLLDTAHVQLGIDDIVLASDTRAELIELIGAIRTRRMVMEGWGLGRRLSRGRGLSALFDGEPGTGKTMAAEVVAHEVDLPLRRVNVATLVNKYIGETEKNLQRVFVEARNDSCILLFDEADSLFGARTDVKGANDRYANLEVNVLLQLMEEHGGVVILTTNLRRNIDQAFMRRLSYKVQFDVPDDGLREHIWRGMLPRDECDPTVDVRSLACAFPLAGGDIKSATLRASYRAAATGRKVSMADLVECAQLECQAKGRVVSWRS
jgi:ATPase family associated with various cellular activities (AAA)